MKREEYRKYCEETPGLPLFMQAWWMDAVCAGKGWEVIAGMPCLVRERVGMRFVVMPQETQIGGRFVKVKGYGLQVTEEPLPTETGFPVKRGHLWVTEIAEEIARELKERKLDYYYQHFPIGSPLPEELEKRGFTIRKHTTYRIEDLKDLEAVRKRYTENKRRQIKKAATLELVDVEPERFYAFHKACLEKQGKEIAYSEAFFHSLNTACEQHEARKILGLQDASSALHAAVYLVYDKTTCYFLIPCYAPEFGNSGAGARIADEAIRFASEKGLAFDFEGSMIPGVANHYAQFGSTPRYFYEVEKVYNPLFRIVLKVYHLMTRKKR